MRLAPLFGVLGALLYGIVGYYLGVSIVGTYQLTTASGPVVWTATIAGMVVGYFLAPWLIIAPARAARNFLRSVPMDDLVAATIGLAVGLLIAALLAYPISRLPPPFGGILPLVAGLIFGYLGATVMTLRKADFFSLLRPVERQATAAERMAGQPLLLDTSVIIDGRIADVADTGFLMGKLLAPRFVLNELQYIADSADPLRRNREPPRPEMLDAAAESRRRDWFIDLDPQDAPAGRRQADQPCPQLGAHHHQRL